MRKLTGARERRKHYSFEADPPSRSGSPNFVFGGAQKLTTKKQSRHARRRRRATA
jgi:hypothetical protein